MFKSLKKVSLFISLLLMIISCKEQNRSISNIIAIDVENTTFSKKELILQDFMDVEYIPLETNDEFVNQGVVCSVGEKLILVKNRKNDGTVFVYDRSGKALRKFNKKGQGAEEYVNILGMVLDEENEEIFINSHYINKILVYDLFGNYKRTLSYKAVNGTWNGNEITSFFYDMFNYNKDNLICYDILNAEAPFVFISKKDGSIVRKVSIPFKEKKMAMARLKDEKSGLVNTASSGHYRTIIPFKKEWLLLEFSSDTIYQLLPNYDLRPVFVRTPPVDSMNPEVFLMLRLLSDRYIFMETVKNEYDFDQSKGFPRNFFMYDKKLNEFFDYRVYNGDYSTKDEIYMNFSKAVDGEIESWQKIDAFSLLESLEKGELKGRLKEIASTLKEDDNPIIMLIKHKK